MTDSNQPKPESWYAEQSMNWHGWGSPVGLGLFLVSIRRIRVAALACGDLALSARRARLCARYAALSCRASR